jgi:hypothetical protein
MTRPKRPRDVNQLAKTIADLTTRTRTEETPRPRRASTQSKPKPRTSKPRPPKETGKNPMAVALGRMGGLKGGRARADSMSEEERRISAIHAAKARWQNRKD